MSIKQKLTDIKDLLKKDRKAKFLAGVALVFVLAFIFSTPPERNKKPKKVRRTTETSLSDQGDAYNDLIQAFKTQLDTIEGATKQNAESIEDIRKGVDEYEERTAEIFKKIIHRLENQQVDPNRPQTVNQYNEPVDGAVLPTGLGGEEGTGESDSLEQFGDINQPQVAPPPPPEREKIARISAADSVRVQLLAGVNAPTDGTPYPVIFKLVGDVQGPDGSTLPLGEARLMAAAQGSLTDSRALFRLTTLSIRFPNGKRHEVDVDGWIVGEDGIRGMQGILIDPIGKAIAGAAMVGGIGGIGQGLAAAQTTTTIDRNGNAFENLDGDLALFAGGRALAGASNEWKQILANRLNQLVPAVKVLSGREATAVFAKSVSINGLYDVLDDEVDIFSPLD